MPPRRKLLRWHSLGFLALASIVLWFLAGSLVLRREFHADIRSARGLGDLSLRWTKPGASHPHGVWIDDNSMDPAILEVRPSGIAATPGTGFELWLYTVKDSSGMEFDLKQIIDDADAQAVQGSWIPFDKGPGVVYTASTPGCLRIRIATREVRLEFAHTSTGGPVEFRFRGQSQVVNTFAQTNSVESLTLPIGAGTSDSIQFSQVLPTYQADSLELSWKGPIGATVSLHRPTLTFSVAGWEVASRLVRCLPLAGLSTTTEGEWTTQGERPTLSLVVAQSPGPWLHAAGVTGTLIVVLLARAGWWFLWGVIGWFGRSAIRVQLLVAGVLVAMNLSMALSTPVSVTSDGMDYISGAAGLAYPPHTMDRIPLYKAPGLMFVLAVCMRLGRDFLMVFGVMQALFSLSTSALAYYLLRERVGRGWATAAAFYVGIHPILVTYQKYLLRENLAAMFYLGVAVLLLALARPRASRSPRWSVMIAIAAGVVCGLGAYVRENFQILFLMVPVAVVVAARGGLGRRGMLGGVTLVAACLTLVPYLAVRCWPNGVVGVVQGKTHANRALNVWNNRVTDGNDTAYLSHEEWLSLDRDSKASLVSDFDYIGAYRAGSPYLARQNGLEVEPSTRPGYLEGTMKDIADEAVARHPLAQARAMGISFFNQLGLWNFYWPPDAASGAWYSKALRGQPTDFTTNYHVGTDWMLTNDLYTPYKDQLQDLVRRTAHPQRSTEASMRQNLFNELFWAARFVRPGIACLFLIGVVGAVRRGDRALAAVGLMTLLMMLAAAGVVAPATDRFAAPFVPVLVCVAFHTLGTWKRGHSSPESPP